MKSKEGLSQGVIAFRAKNQKKIKQISFQSFCFLVAQIGLYNINTEFGERNDCY